MKAHSSNIVLTFSVTDSELINTVPCKPLKTLYWYLLHMLRNLAFEYKKIKSLYYIFKTPIMWSIHNYYPTPPLYDEIILKISSPLVFCWASEEGLLHGPASNPPGECPPRTCAFSHPEAHLLHHQPPPLQHVCSHQDSTHTLHCAFYSRNFNKNL